MEVADIFRNNERGNAEEANKLMQEFHINLTSVMEARRFRHRLKLPDIRAVSLD
jgi:WD40 repeat protein